MTGPRYWRIAALGALLVWLAAYANSMENGFHFDDDHVIERNLALRSLRNIPKYFVDARTFSTYPANATYRPLVSATLAVDYAVAGGLHPWAFHATQLLLFLLVGVLFFLLTLDLLRASSEAPWNDWAALFAASLFCLHTGNTEPANYLSARSELLCTIGILGAFLAYLRAPRLRPLQVYLVPMAIGALAKPSAVMFAPLLLAYKLVFEEKLTPQSFRARDWWPRVRRALLSSLPAFVVGAVLFLVIERMNAPGQAYVGVDRWQYLWSECFVWLRYLGLFILPVGLSADSDYGPLPTWEDPRVLMGVIALVVSLVLAARATTRRRLRPVALGIVWFWLGIAPTSTVVPLGQMTNDHRMFTGWLGLTLAVTTFAFDRASGVFASGSRSRRRWLVGLAATFLVAHAVGVHMRNRVWQNEETLWDDVVLQSPNNGRGWMNDGLAKMSRTDYPAARERFDRAAELWPTYSLLAVNQGVLAAATGDPVGAERHFREALELKPSIGLAPSRYAHFLVDQGRAAEAMTYLQQAVDQEFGDPYPRELLMELSAALGRDDQVRDLATRTLALGPDPVAQAYLSRTLSVQPATDTAEGWYDAGTLETRAGHHTLAARIYRRALERQPSVDVEGDCYNNLGWELLQLGFPAEAVTNFEVAARLRPSDERARNNLAAARKRLAQTTDGTASIQ